MDAHAVAEQGNNRRKGQDSQVLNAYPKYPGNEKYSQPFLAEYIFKSTNYSGLRPE